MPGLSEVAQLIAQLQSMDSRIKTLETSLRAQNTSVDAGAFKILSDEGFQVGAEGSGTGSARVYGVLFINGVLQLIGAMEVNDDGSISLGGITLTQNNIDVDGSGTITVGGITIDPSENGGTIDLGSGRQVHAGSGYLGLYDGDNFVVFNASGVTVYAEGRSLQITSSGIRFSGLPTTPLSSAPAGAFVNCVISDSSGNLSRVVAG